MSAQPAMHPMEAVLGAPGDRQHVVRHVVVAAGERGADPGLPRVMPGGFDEDPAGVARAGLGAAADLVA
jgi:hypothetical protein